MTIPLLDAGDAGQGFGPDVGFIDKESPILA